MNYLLLGGAGFIGQALARRLISEGHEVAIVDSLFTSKEPIDIPCQFYRCDLGDMRHQIVKELLRGTDVVYFLAGSVGVEYVDHAPGHAIHNNVDIMTHVMPMLMNAGKKVVFASTSEVYGNGPFAESDGYHLGPLNELRWGYAASKVMTEFMLASSKLPYVILRYFNVTGPGQLPHYGMVLPRFVEAAKTNISLEVYGDGSSVRSFCHIDDAVEYMRRVEGCDNEVFNIGTNHSISILDLAQRVIRLSNSMSGIKFVPYRDKFTTFKKDIVSRIPDTTKLVAATQYKPKYDIDDIIRSML